MGKASPHLLFGQRADQCVQAEGARQGDQQVNTPKLRRTKTQAPAFSSLECKAVVDEGIRNEGREKLKQFRGANRWKLHVQNITESATAVCTKDRAHTFMEQITD